MHMSSCTAQTIVSGSRVCAFLGGNKCKLSASAVFSSSPGCSTETKTPQTPDQKHSLAQASSGSSVSDHGHSPRITVSASSIAVLASPSSWDDRAVEQVTSHLVEDGEEPQDGLRQRGQRLLWKTRPLPPFHKRRSHSVLFSLSLFGGRCRRIHGFQDDAVF